MNSIIETLNLWTEHVARLAGPMLWQSSLLILILFGLDFALRRKVRAAVRYTLWLVIFVKLLLPPSLALPTGVAWWLRQTEPAPALVPQKQVIVTYREPGEIILPAFTPLVREAPAPKLSRPAYLLTSATVISVILLAWLCFRWRQITRKVRQAQPASETLSALLKEAQSLTGLQRKVRLRLTNESMSPAVCGLFRPVILLPESLAQNLSAPQLRAVLLHELIHLRRGDVWVNCLQTLFQIVYWWHPLLWFANARIRRLREEAVDDSVMLALRDDSEIYAPTLLEVAKLTFRRPLASLGLIGILESKHALRQRIERLVNFTTPRRAGLSVVSVLGIAAFTVVAVPMGEAPPLQSADSPSESSLVQVTQTNTSPAVKKVAGSTLIQAGRLFWQFGKLDEAENRFKQALEMDPANEAAIYYSKLVAQAREKEAVARTNLSTSHAQRIPLPRKEREMILAKLHQIYLPSIQFDKTTLGEAIRILAEEARKSDPDKRGVNFVINPSQTHSPIDPVTGLPQGFDMNAVVINIYPSLNNVRLLDVLDAIVQVADRPIKYSLEDYGLIFSPKMAEEPIPLMTRRFKVDPSTFYQALERAGALEPAAANSTSQATNSGNGGLRFLSTHGMDAVQAAVIKFMAAVGVDLSAPKSVFFNDRQGMLLVRATADDLHIIEIAIQFLNEAPTQINVKVRFMEVDQTNRALFDLGNYFAKKDQPFTGILTDSQFQAVKKGLEKSSDATLLSEAQVTTLSGRQAQVQVVDVKTIINGLTTTVTNGQTNFVFDSQHVPFGPTLDVIPAVAADGYTLSLTVIPTVTEFLGYDSPDGFVTNYQGTVPNAQIPLPKFRVRQVTTTARVWDGQTLVLGNFSDMIAMGNPSSNTKKNEYSDKKHLLVFITPTIIDPAGNRVHTDENLPFAKVGVPPQPKQ